jgi:hypothetical protein
MSEEDRNEAALLQECPTCGRAPKTECITAGGSRLSTPHVPRLRRADRVAGRLADRLAERFAERQAPA